MVTFVSAANEVIDDAGGGGRVDADVRAEDLAGERSGERDADERDVCVFRREGDDGCSASQEDRKRVISAMSCSVHVCMWLLTEKAKPWFCISSWSASDADTVFNVSLSIGLLKPWDGGGFECSCLPDITTHKSSREPAANNKGYAAI